MVTKSKKPAADAPAKKAAKPKAAPSPKAAAKPKAAAPMKVAAQAAPKKAAPVKAAPKAAAPSSKAAPKTSEVLKVPDVGRAIGEMVYNDELFEAMSEIILLGSGEVSPSLMPEIKKQLFDFDIYMTSFLTDDDVRNIAQVLKVPEPLLFTLRDNARIFVDIAERHYSVRGFIDKMIEAEGKTHGIDKLKLIFTDELKAREPEHYERFLLLF